MDTNQAQSLKWLYGILAIVAVVAIIVVVFFVSKAPSKPRSAPQKNSETSKETTPKINKKEVEPSKLPDRFPKDVPMEAGAKVEQNYTAQADTGQFQATRVFVTAKSLDENYKIYKTYITDKGWKIVSDVNQEDLKVLGAQKGIGFLQINANENSITKIKTVNISYSEQPK